MTVQLLPDMCGASSVRKLGGMAIINLPLLSLAG